MKTEHIDLIKQLVNLEIKYLESAGWTKYDTALERGLPGECAWSNGTQLRIISHREALTAQKQKDWRDLNSLRIK